MTNSLTPRLAAAAAALAVLLTGCAQVAPTGAVPAQTGSPIPSTSPSTATTPASTTSTPTRTPSTPAATVLGQQTGTWPMSFGSIHGKVLVEGTVYEPSKVGDTPKNYVPGEHRVIACPTGADTVAPIKAIEKATGIRSVIGTAPEFYESQTVVEFATAADAAALYTELVETNKSCPDTFATDKVHGHKQFQAPITVAGADKAVLFGFGNVYGPGGTGLMGANYWAAQKGRTVVLLSQKGSGLPNADYVARTAKVVEAQLKASCDAGGC